MTARRSKKDPWATVLNAERGRPMVTITMAPEGLAELDRMRGALSRGTYIEMLLEKHKAELTRRAAVLEKRSKKTT